MTETCAGASDDAVVAIDVPSRVEHLWIVRHVLREAVPNLYEQDDELYLGAVTESVVNAIEAHRRAEVADPVRVEVAIAGEEPTSLRVRDAGGGLAQGSDPETGHLGVGRRIAASIVPAMTTEAVDGGTEVTLPLPEPPEAAR